MTDQNPERRPEDAPAPEPTAAQQPPTPEQPPPPQQYAPPPAYGQQPGGYQAYPGGAAAGGYSTELSPADQRMWAMLAHLGAILFGFLAPLIVYLVQKDRGAYVREQSREALNFNLTLLVAYVVVAIFSVITFGIGAFLIFPLVIVNIVFPILAGVAANRGENYRYPVAWRMVS
ncbi:MAG: DUF4870 domain-containing protein [Actinomycetota bacterium]